MSLILTSLDIVFPAGPETSDFTIASGSALAPTWSPIQQLYPCVKQLLLEDDYLPPLSVKLPLTLINEIEVWLKLNKLAHDITFTDILQHILNMLILFDIL
jgi:hypothetical protein